MRLKAKTNHEERSERRAEARHGLREWVVIIPLILGAIAVTASVLKVFASSDQPDKGKNAFDWGAFSAEIIAVVGSIFVQVGINAMRLVQIRDLIRREDPEAGLAKGQSALTWVGAITGLCLEIASIITFLKDAKIPTAILGTLAPFFAAAIGGLAQKRLEDEYTMILMNHNAVEQERRVVDLEINGFQRCVGTSQDITQQKAYAIENIPLGRVKEALELYRATLAERRERLTFADQVRRPQGPDLVEEEQPDFARNARLPNGLARSQQMERV